MNAWSTAMAVEQKGKGTNVMLGPDIRILTKKKKKKVMFDHGRLGTSTPWRKNI
jgi:hypothetical protein